MTIRQLIRPGGRSERVQKAVHAAVRDLTSRRAAGDLTIPMIAAEAGVTPSTIYRRWGNLTELMADVAVERLRPDGEPDDTGSFRGDLDAWLEQFAEEMSSGPGQAMMRDVLASSDGEAKTARCGSYTLGQVSMLVDRAARRNEAVPAVEFVVDMVVAPIMYRILFIGEEITADYRRTLLERTMGTAAE